ncbi:nonsense-mediated mRNA decay factor SMG7 [Andrographis paniculata]|uniref:nonsense-mediated mRNA decay factor SMG7 n=1 Tax=Andrographis paniculata TaxID=175694 RepID=UPI0021E76B4C|nr:nonsense-mediated mRNA decay factor SMG7 [Andrographis paniculata]XP_051149560.1 nonsense-mediated mRNA decay factor SMG7 [Andrographis paniculata]XP_051149561.1 nonsense-mediated mRNA decay factor SMG7 [Andrographis paniculata]XP_051149562.1 nonsense-mediated mRNA decay factor SMG7 [Andrographis paniculata]XP_051149563.1 nonsense-mediated mRNA decay factor SMG7 [Andrographis paniculata]XP_051149564.1 nonsense-mediated mRNA decay factor SMG7 [Andrographis paniculata]XP_051149565.1 nonsense
MTASMDNNRENSSRERVQHLFNKNVELENKRRKAAQARVPSDPNAWQTMRENYEAIILEDHEFSEQHDVEYALWQLHYRRIEELRVLFNAALASSGSGAPQNGKGPARAGPERFTKIRTQFKTFLSEATGFYHDLMLKIRAKYGLPFGYFSDDSDNQTPMSKDGNKSSELKKGLMSCHRCFIYLGDLARYKGLYGEGDAKARDFDAASSYYMQASSLWHSSGNPHHQLAILAGYSNDELVSIYRYFRSLAVESPFITARDNLIIAFEKNRQNFTQLLGDSKSTSKPKMPTSRVPGRGRNKGEPRPPLKDEKVEASDVKEKSPATVEPLKAFITRFIRMNGILFTRTSLETFDDVLSMVKTDVVELISSGPNEEFNFGSDAAECRLAIIRMVAILIFTVYNVNKEHENQSYADILQRSVLLQNAFTAVFEFMGFLLDRCSQLNDPSSSYLLPGIMVFVEWLACHQDVAVGNELEKQVSAKSFFWKKCVSFLNKLLTSGYAFVNEDDDETCFSNMSKYDESETTNRVALPEDFELRGFLPLLPAQLILDFSRKHSFVTELGNKDKIARVRRIVAAGKALANVVRIGQEGVHFDYKHKKFLFGAEPQVSEDFLLTNDSDPKVGDHSVIGHMAVGAGTSVKETIVEAEDDDEVIVFKPSINEKHIDDLSSQFSTSNVLASVSGSGKTDIWNENGTFSTGNDSLFQAALSVGNTKPALTGSDAVISNGTSPYLQSVQPGTSKWALENVPPIMNGLAHLPLMENGVSHTLGMQDKFSSPYSQFVDAGSSRNYSSQIPQAAMLSKFGSIVCSGAPSDVQSVKPSSVMPPGVKKNPVGRPVRHLGPPPGFGSVPSKVADESHYNLAPRSETPILPMDDYSWLDGYQMPPSNQNVGFSSSMNHTNPSFSSVSKSNSSMGIENFPFPGKQASPLQVQLENHKGWQESQHLEHIQQHFHEQQQQFQKGNQQPGGPPQQHQGQSFWDGRYFV